MSQRILFAGLPGTAPLAWVPTLIPFLAEVDRSRPLVRGVKEWLRMRNLFDPGSWEILMEMLEVRLGEPVTLGRTARDLLEAPDDGAARAVLARRLVEENPLLARYCLQALDVEQEGRLHSTNELFRMISSYVYPGEKPTLVSFRAWVDWAVAANLLKLVGIRWALGEGAREVLPRLRALDPEEFLEEERLARQGPAAAPAGEEPEDRPLEAGPAEGPAGEDRGGTAPGLPEEAVPAAPGGSTGDGPGAPEAPGTRGEGARPAGLHETRPSTPTVPSRDPAVPRLVPRPFPEEAAPRLVPPVLDLEATRRLLLAARDRDPGRPAPLAVRTGLSEPLESAFGALLLSRGISPEEVRRGMETVRGTGLFREAAAGTLTLAALASAEAGAADEGTVRVLALFPALPRLQAGLRDPGLFRGDDPREWAERVWRRLYAPRDPLAPFWLARLLLGQGRLEERLAPVSVVPHFQVRENAFRIGFLDRIHAAAFPDLAEAAVRLAEGFPPDPAEHPLERVHEGLGCAFRCPRALVCPLSCRERLELAPGNPGR
ncbi:hypothetical protein KBD49_14445 [Myxococcota bacterium]|nr:hypothetical protein [Myxococcota bacterium]